jgi:hypothetical protein
MDHLQTRLEALEHHMHAVNHRLRWWRGLACGLAVAGLLGWGLPLGLAREDARDKDKDQKGLAQRVDALEQLLQHFSREKNEIFITGANLHIVNGLGRTDCGSEEEPIPDCPNGLGNLIVGYNEPREFEDPVHTGSHNVVIGRQHHFSRFGGLVVGNSNNILGDFAVVSGGQFNTAIGASSSVSGGGDNTASGINSSVSGGASTRATGFGASISGGGGNLANGDFASVSGGRLNTASADSASVCGGQENMASGFATTVSGGSGNTASEFAATVSGGEFNTASGSLSSVSGGSRNTASGIVATVSGGGANEASGPGAVVSGGGSAQEGEGNTASGNFASISGGQNVTQATEFGWAAGSEGDEVVVANFRSP